MQILPTHELHNLSTSRLLALYRKKYKYMKSGYALITDYGAFPEALKNKDDPFVKDVTELNRYCDEMKAILDERENVEKERK